jgi:DNA-binding PadR family transcriptional regulator
MPRKRSHQARLILRVLLDAPTEEAYGLEIVRASGVSAGTSYAILRRLEDEGLLDGRWEQISPEEQGRPPRRFYRLNGAGRRVAHRETADDRRALRLLVPGWSAR